MAQFKILLILLWVGVAVSAVVDLQKRIIGGEKCKVEERPYHVKLTTTTPTETFMCGGSLISNQWILTAAHCWDETGTKIQAVLGVHPKTNPKKKTVEITEKPLIYNDGKDHDIMLLKLNDVTDIPHVELPKNCDGRPTLSKKVQVAGHAATHAGPDGKKINDESEELQCVDIEVVDCKNLMETLEKNFPKFLEKNEHNHLFCGQSSKKDTCPGDSGGGVVYEKQLYGVHKFSGSKTACTEPAGFMDICKYIDWINEKIGNKKNTG